MSRITLCFVLLMGSLGLVRDAFGQTRIPFESGAWYTALSEEYHVSFLHIQVGSAPEGPAIKAVFEDSLTAALPLDRQEAAARTVAQYILAKAATEPQLAVVIVGWRRTVDGIPTARTFRFSASELRVGPPKATSQ